MYQEEVKAYDTGKSEEKPKPLKKEMKQTKQEVTEMKEKKIDKKLKETVKNFFNAKKSEKAGYQIGLKPQKPKLRDSKSCGKSGKRKSKKAS